MAKAFSPIILSTWTFGQIGNAAGWPVLARGGKSIDAVEQACIAVESDPEVDSVGIGGTPDAEGKVTLDGSIMLKLRCVLWRQWEAGSQPAPAI